MDKLIERLHEAHHVICGAVQLTSFTASAIQDEEELAKLIDARAMLRTWLDEYQEPDARSQSTPDILRSDD